MIAYTRLVTDNFEKAAVFYDEFLAALNASRIIDTKNVIAWSPSVHATALSISRKSDDDPEVQGDSHMVAFVLDSIDEVDALYKKALELGATVETELSKLKNGFYSGYLRDLDGHKLRVFCVTA